MIYMGIDPGAGGGIACIDDAGDVVDTLTVGGTTMLGLWEFLDTKCREMARRSGAWRAALEKVGGYTKEGGPQPGSTMFNFGAGYGALQMALTAAAVPYELVTPQRWQKALHIPPRKKVETKTEWKRRLRGEAERLFPRTKVTNALADALLIAEYLRRERTG